jgi:hypothetical protein
VTGLFEVNKPKYMTKSIQEELSFEHQQFILRYIHENHNCLNDYLQIFMFYSENNQQWLNQQQEVPKRKKVLFVPLNQSKPINRKVWVMDQGDHVIMLFPEDY